MTVRDFGRARLRPSRMVPRLARRLALPGSRKGDSLLSHRERSRSRPLQTVPARSLGNLAIGPEDQALYAGQRIDKPEAFLRIEDTADLGEGIGVGASFGDDRRGGDSLHRPACSWVEDMRVPLVLDREPAPGFAAGGDRAVLHLDMHVRLRRL